MPKKITTTTTTVVETTEAARTRVTFVLDKSSSMIPLIPATREGYNTYIKTLKDSGEDIVFTQVQFDTISIVTSPTLPIAEVPMLDHDNYKPMGGTPLIDAAVKAILATETAAKPHEKVIVCIQTDGEENSSVEYKMADLHQIIKRLSAKGWQFNFMGTGIDAYKQGEAMGISRASTMTYGQSVGETRSAFYSSASNTSAFAAGAASSTEYSGMQKLQAGDPTAQGGPGGAAGALGTALGGVGKVQTKVTPIKPLVDTPKID